MINFDEEFNLKHPNSLTKFAPTQQLYRKN